MMGFDKKNKALIVLIFSFAVLLLFSLITYITWLTDSTWDSLVFGILFMIIAIPFLAFGSDINGCCITSIVLNTMGDGFVVGAYYLNSGADVRFWQLLVGVLPAICVISAVYLIYQFLCIEKKKAVIAMLIVQGVLVLISVILWIAVGSAIFSFWFFSIIISLFYLLTFYLTVDKSERNVMKEIALGSFCIPAIVITVGILILTKGEILEALEDIDFRKKSKK